MEPTTPSNNGRWRLSKDIPVSVLGFIIVQTVLGVWFFAQQNALLASTVETVNKSQTTTYTKEDARHEREFIEQKLLNASLKTDELMRRLQVVESMVNTLSPRK